MKYILINIIIAFPIVLLAQEKDSLFFAIDKYYTISPTIEPNFYKNLACSEVIKNKKNQMVHTKTNGNIFL